MFKNVRISKIRFDSIWLCMFKAHLHWAKAIFLWSLSLFNVNIKFPVNTSGSEVGFAVILLPYRRTLKWHFIWLVTGRRRSCGKVMFLLVSICLFMGREEVLNVTITHDTLDLTLQGPSPRHQIWDYPPVLSSSASDIWWYKSITGDLFKLFHLNIHPPPSTDIWWSKHIWLASGWYASYWMLSCLHLISFSLIRGQA